MVLAAAVRTFAALPADGLVPSYGYSEVTVAGQAGVSGLAVSGTLEKRGAGTLTLTNLLSVPGTVIAREGTVALAETAPSVLPASLQGGLAFWVDANTNYVLNGSGTVEKWLDVREASMDAPYTYMRAEHDFTYYVDGPRSRRPSRVQGVSDVNGNAMMDFGTFGAIDATAAWLPWRNADGTRGVLSNIRAVFAVVAFPDSTGFLLGDWDYTVAGNNGVVHFSIGTNVSYWQGTAPIYKYYMMWHPNTEAYKGVTYLNGIHVDGGSRVPDALGQVMDVMTASPLTAGNFFNVLNADGDIPYIGGGRVGEFLVYTNVLTEAERLAVEGYLLRKWKGAAQVGTQRVEPGATLVTDTPAGTTLKASGVVGGGLWRKTGAGTVSLSDEFDLMQGAIQLEDGTLVDDGRVRRPNRLFAVPAQGVAVLAEPGRWEASAAPANTLVKSGAGEMTVTGFPQSVTSVAVGGGTLRLTQALRDAEQTEAVTIYNNSFEIFDNLDNKGPWGGPQNVWGLMPTGTGWTLIGSATPADATNVGGLYDPSSANIWCAAQPAPDGTWVAFIKQGGGWETAFTAPSAGRYRLVFFTAGRSGDYINHRYNILIDGQAIAHVRTTQTLFERYAFTLPQLSAGSHTLTFQGINEGTDRGSVLDDVRVERTGDFQIEATVPNGTFEVSDNLIQPYSATLPPYLVSDRGYYSWDSLGNSGWAFNGSSGISEGFSPWISQRKVAEGSRTAYLHEVNGVMSTTVTFPTNGVYELSYLTAARPYWNNGAADNHNLHNYYVKLDGTIIAYRFNYKTEFETMTVRLPAITNAPVSKTLSFEAINVYGGDRSSLIDDVRVTRLDGNAVVDGGFEVPVSVLPNSWDVYGHWGDGVTGTAWTFDTAWASSGITQNNATWGNSPAPEGTCAAFIRMGYKLSQPITFAEDGGYTLSFMASGRMRESPKYCLHDFRVLFKGEQVGYVQTVDDTWRRYTFRLPYVKAGVAYTLMFEGINSMFNQLGMGEDHDSFIDDVRIVKQTAVSAAGTPGVYKNVVVRLDAGSKLALDFPGQTAFKELWYDGQLYSGTLNASNTPFLTGAGSVFVAPKGTIIRIQ